MPTWGCSLPTSTSWAARCTGGTGSAHPRREASAGELVPARMRMELDASQASLGGRVIFGGAKPLREPAGGQGIAEDGGSSRTGHQALHASSSHWEAVLPVLSLDAASANT